MIIDKKTLIVLILIVFSLFLLECYLIFQIKDNKYNCIKNPYIYGAKLMKNVKCDCIQMRYGNVLMFSFNETSMFNNNPINNHNSNNDVIDWGSLNISGD